jgi:hypothetical protein
MNIQDNQYRTIGGVTDAILRLTGGGVRSVDNRFDVPFIQQMVVAAIPMLVKSYYTGNRGLAQNHYIPDICKQTLELFYDESLQDDPCWNKFPCPDFISLDNDSNGLRFGGSTNGRTSFMILRSEEQYRQYLGNPTKVKIMNKNVLIMYKADERVLKVRDVAPGYKDLKSGTIRGVFSNFTELPGFNKDTDPIPMDGNSINSLIGAIYNIIRLPSYATPDEIADGADSTKQANLQRQMFNAFIKNANSSITV